MSASRKSIVSAPRKSIIEYIENTNAATRGGFDFESVEPLEHQSLETLELERGYPAEYDGVSFRNPLEGHLLDLEWYESIIGSKREEKEEDEIKGTSGHDAKAKSRAGDTRKSIASNISATNLESREFQHFLHRLTHWSMETDKQLRWTSNVVRNGLFENTYNALFSCGGAESVQARTRAMFRRNKETELWEDTGVKVAPSKMPSGREAIDDLLREFSAPSRVAVIDNRVDESKPSALFPSIDGMSSTMSGNELFVSMINCFNTNTKYDPSVLEALSKNIDRIPCSEKEHKAIGGMLKTIFTDFHDFCQVRDKDVEYHRDFKRDYGHISYSEPEPKNFYRDPKDEFEARALARSRNPASASEGEAKEHWYRMKLGDYTERINQKLIKAGGSLRNDSSKGTGRPRT